VEITLESRLSKRTRVDRGPEPTHPKEVTK
jgi:hypothetical protein